MKNASLKIIFSFLFLWMLFQLQRLIFAATYFNGQTIADYVDVCLHGAAMDCSVAGYLTAPIALITILSIYLPAKISKTAISVYVALVAILISAVTILDLDLYSYWGFRLDSTPLFYFISSPRSAFASATIWQMVGGGISLIILSWLISFGFENSVGKINLNRISGNSKKRIAAAVSLIVLTAMLIIPIRGGLGLSPMNLSRAYFSDNKLLNHAAVNPQFSLLYSLTHHDPSGSDFRYFNSVAEAQQILDRFSDELIVSSDSVTPTVKLNTDRPHIYLIILESFSSHLLPSQRGDSVAMRLDSIAATGTLFDNFYANSFRTDRALPSILSGLPAQPTMSVLKHAEKTERLPSLASSLSAAGYHTRYYYGGDINFANIQAYLVNSGYNNIISENDFPDSLRTGKWGVHDADLFTRVLSDEDSNDSGEPMFITIQTSSSHEPFIVPFKSKFGADTPLNAFAYTDKAVGDFIEQLKRTPRWGKSLVVIVPDHLGAWPLGKADAAERHHIPMIFTGGALSAESARRIKTPGAQSDITATLLGMLEIDSSDFPFSKNILSDRISHYGIFTETELIGIISARDTLYYNTASDHIEKNTGLDDSSARAYLQLLYQYISEL